MIAVAGIYDWENVLPLEKIPMSKKYKVIITFVEEIDELEEIRQTAAQMDSFKFWESQEEDIYQDYLAAK